MKMDDAPVHIVADDREKAGGKMLAALAGCDDARVEIARLPVGDYRIEHRVVVERKTAADFAAPLIDGRLFHQAAALAIGPERAVLVLEGCDKDWHDTGVRREALRLSRLAYTMAWPCVPQCAGARRIIAFIEQPAVINKILRHLGLWPAPSHSPPAAARPLPLSLQRVIAA